MKPRLAVRDWTSEDRSIFNQLGHFKSQRIQRRMIERFIECDRRDADLMLELTDLRSIGAYTDVRTLQTLAGEDGCAVGGKMGHYRWVSDRDAVDGSGFTCYVHL